MIMYKTQSAFAPGNGNSSMSNFMSGLLRERASQSGAHPNAQWSISIVNDNARPKQIDKRKAMMMQKQKAPSNRDLRWASNTVATNGGMKASSSDNSLSDCLAMTRNSRRTGMMKYSTPNGNGRSRFDSCSRLPTASGLKRGAASDTMLLKMPVRSKSPASLSANRGMGRVSKANAIWENPKQAEQSKKKGSIPGLAKLPAFDLALEKATVSTGRMKKSRSDTQSKQKLSRKKDSLRPTSSSESLRARASMLGLDLRG